MAVYKRGVGVSGVYLPSLMKSLTRSPIIIVVTLVLARMQSGMMDASTTRSPSRPCTLPYWSTTAIGSARKDIREGRVLPVPVHLRDSHYGGARQLGHGEGYLYAHNEEEGIASQDYLGVERIYYQPVERGFEAELLERLETIRARLRNARQVPLEPDSENESP